MLAVTSSHDIELFREDAQRYPGMTADPEPEPIVIAGFHYPQFGSTVKRKCCMRALKNGFDVDIRGVIYQE